MGELEKRNLEVVKHWAETYNHDDVTGGVGMVDTNVAPRS